MREAGLATKSLLKVKVQVQSLPRRRTCGIPLHYLLHAPQLRIRTTAKSIAVRKLQSPKKLHGGLRGEKRGLRLKS